MAAVFEKSKFCHFWRAVNHQDLIFCKSCEILVKVNLFGYSKIKTDLKNLFPIKSYDHFKIANENTCFLYIDDVSRLPWKQQKFFVIFRNIL